MRKWILIVIIVICGNYSFSQPWDTDSLYELKNTNYIRAFDYDQSMSFIASRDQSHRQTPVFRKKRLQDNPALFFGFGIIFLLALFTVFVTPDYFRSILLNVTRSRYLMETTVRKRTPFLINNIILDILFVTVFSLLLFQYQWEQSHYLYIEVFLSISGFYFIQIIVVYVAYYIFFGSKFKNIHIANIMYFNRVLVLILAPVCFLITYSFDPVTTLSSGLVLYLIIVIIVFRLIRTYFQIKKQYSFNAIYIILYLCVFEISLYFIFMKEFYWLI